MTDYASWELQGWRDIYEDRDADGEQVLAVYAHGDTIRCLYRSKVSGKIFHSCSDTCLIKRQPPRMYAAQFPCGYTTVWASREVAKKTIDTNPGARLISCPADAEPQDFTQWRVEQ
jgi:hypothetical protein